MSDPRIHMKFYSYMPEPPRSRLRRMIDRFLRRSKSAAGEYTGAYTWPSTRTVKPPEEA